MGSESFWERNQAVCDEMDRLSRAVEGREFKEGSEAWKFQRMSSPKVWQDYGYSVNVQKLMEELEASREG